MSTSTKPVLNGFENDLVFDSIPDCIAAFGRGEFLIVLDAPTRENEGDLLIAAAHLTPEKCAFLIRYSSGYLCAPLSPARAEQLNIRAMIRPEEVTDPLRTAYTVSVDARIPSVTTGISAQDRSATANLLADPSATADSFIKPGHMLPLLAKKGGVRERRGHTEAGWEFARLAGLEPAVCVIGEMVVDGQESTEASSQGLPKKPELFDPGMMRAPECLKFAKEWGIRCCTIEDLVKYVEEKEGKLAIEPTIPAEAVAVSA